jgi:hypothetical protein
MPIATDGTAPHKEHRRGAARARTGNAMIDFCSDDTGQRERTCMSLASTSGLWVPKACVEALIVSQRTPREGSDETHLSQPASVAMHR